MFKNVISIRKFKICEYLMALNIWQKYTFFPVFFILNSRYLEAKCSTQETGISTLKQDTSYKIVPHIEYEAFQIDPISSYIPIFGINEMLNFVISISHLNNEVTIILWIIESNLVRILDIKMSVPISNVCGTVFCIEVNFGGITKNLN